MLRAFARATLRNPIQKWSIFKTTEIKSCQVAAPLHTTSTRAKDDKKPKLPRATRYEVFKEENATVILDMEDELAKLSNEKEEIEIVEEAEANEFDQFSQTRMPP